MGLSVIWAAPEAPVMQTVWDENEDLQRARARNISDALREDLGTGDWTAMLVPERLVHAQLVVREDAVLCGQEWFAGCIRALDPQAHLTWAAQDGARMRADQVVCTLSAQSRALLTAERAALNFLQTLSATATQTARYVSAIAGASPNPRGCLILDTRKTLPGLRQAQKYAVRMGGGANQRMALWDGILIKENHIAAAGGISQALQAARALLSSHASDGTISLQIEVETIAQLHEALREGAQSLLLDNFSLEGLRDAVAQTWSFAQAEGRTPALLEASGGLSLDQLRAVAHTGVDRISVGRLTKDITATDYSLRVV
jgi:nicotinate-nucleotide pyrophosphorylase (carboxylating)